jgi:hypothetical protein
MNDGSAPLASPRTPTAPASSSDSPLPQTTAKRAAKRPKKGTTATPLHHIVPHAHADRDRSSGFEGAAVEVRAGDDLETDSTTSVPKGGPTTTTTTTTTTIPTTSNQYLETLFTVHVVVLPEANGETATASLNHPNTTTTTSNHGNLLLSALPGMSFMPQLGGGMGGGAPTLPLPAFGDGAPAPPPCTTTIAARTHYMRLNPSIDTERLMVPFTGPVQHNGSECAPNERIIQVARYGRIYKRKSPMTTSLRNNMSAPPNTRFCKICRDFLPEEAFYTHIRRYVCKRHHAERIHQFRNSFDATENIAFKMWFDLNAWANSIGYLNLNFDCQDIRSLMIHAGIPFSMRTRIMPIDPSIPMRPRNVAIVGQKTFSLICQGYEHMCSRALFIAQVQRCNLLPAKLDPGWPENPWHDPHYQRQDMDVGPLLLAELQGPLDCVDRTVIEALVHTEPRAPWVQHAESSLPLSLVMRERWGLHLQRKKKSEKAAAAAGGAPPAEVPQDEASMAAAGLRREKADAEAVAAAAIAPRRRCTPLSIKT